MNAFEYVKYNEEKRMNITTIVRDASLQGGGILGVAIPLHQALIKSEINCQFISGNESYQPLINAHQSGLYGCKFNTLPNSAIGDVVHIHGIWTLFEIRAFLYAKKRGARIVFSPHGALELWAFKNKSIKKKLAWWIYQKHILQSSDIFIVNSKQEKVRLRELGLKPPIYIIPNGVEMDGLSERKSIKIKRSRVVLFFSRLDKKKGALELIDAWSELNDRKGYILHIQGYGDKSYTKSLVDRVKILGLEKEIIFLAPVFGVERWSVFLESSIYVLPTYSENFGITVAEALLAGLPVITTIATPWEELSDEGIGWIVNNNKKELSDALQKAISLEDSELLDMSNKAESYAANKFNWKFISEEYINVYSSVYYNNQASTDEYIDV